MKKKVLEVNVDDLNMGGVYGLVKNVVINNNKNVKIDIAAIEGFSSQKNISLLNQYNCDVYNVGYDGNKVVKQFFVFFNLVRLIKKEKYQYVHIHADVANKLFVPGIAAKVSGTSKIIFHSHAAGIDGEKRKIKYFIHILLRRSLKHIATNLVACSDVAAEWMFPNADKQEIIVINNGVDLEKFYFDQKKRRDIRQSLNIQDEILIGHVGRFCYQKNHEYLVKIMKHVKGKNIRARLLLVGEGPDEKRIREMVQFEKLDNDIIFYGISNSVNELFMAMDIFILPSHFEGLPIVGVEAQASGLPVIFSNRITQEAKLTNKVLYLGIEDNDIEQWVQAISQFSQQIEDRDNGYFNLKAKKFDIKDTVCSFMRLYGE